MYLLTYLLTYFCPLPNRQAFLSPQKRQTVFPLTVVLWKHGRIATPLGRRTDAVTVLLISENGTILWRVLNFDRSTVKDSLQSTRNDCHHNFRVHQTRFRPWLLTQVRGPAPGKYSVFWKMQPPVAADDVIGGREFF